MHANDHVNMGQSSNDVIPTAIHVARRCCSASICCRRCASRARCSSKRARELGRVVKTGRTHLMDAMPITLAQELGGWRTQIDKGCARLGP